MMWSLFSRSLKKSGELLRRDKEVTSKEEAEKAKPKKSEPAHPFAEVPCRYGQHEIELIALEAFEETTYSPKSCLRWVMTGSIASRRRKRFRIAALFVRDCPLGARCTQYRLYAAFYLAPPDFTQ